MEKYTYVKTIKPNKTFLYKEKTTGTLFEVTKNNKSVESAQLDFPFKVKPFEVNSVGENTWTVYPYKPEKSLNIIFQQNDYLEEIYIRAIIHEITAILSHLHQRDLTTLLFYLDNFKFSESGDLLITDMDNLKQNSNEEDRAEDIENLVSFIYTISRFDKKKSIEFCASRKFSKFLKDLEEIRVSDKPSKDKLTLIKQHAFLNSKVHKKSVLVDLIDSYEEDQTILQTNDKDSDKKEGPGLSVGVSLNTTKEDTETVISVIEDVFDKHLKNAENEKVTYQTLKNIKKNIIELTRQNPTGLQHLVRNYLNYRSLS